MKKILLALAAVLTVMSASANPFSIANRHKLIPGGYPGMGPLERTDIEIKNGVPSRATSDDEVYYTLAGEPVDALPHYQQKAKSQIAMAFQVEPTFLSSISNAEINEISFYTGYNTRSRLNAIQKATVFITDNLTGNFLYTQDVEITSTEPLTKISVPLTEPFAIPADKKIYVGVYFTVPTTYDYVLVPDGLIHFNNNGGWVGIRNSSTASWSWDNTTDYYGFYCLGATIKANNLPTDAVSVIAVAAQPIASENEQFQVQFMLQNNGVNDISAITVEYGVENDVMKDQDFTLENKWIFNQAIIGSVYITPTKGAKETNIIINVKKIDGADNKDESATGTTPITIIPAGKGYKKNVVVEEFTSTSCSYCPTGYTAMEKLREDYPDGNVIPISVHVNSPGSDPMTATSFNSLWTKYRSEGTPTAAIDRVTTVYPYYPDLVDYVERYLSLSAISQVNAKAKLDAATRTLTIDTETEFSFDYTDGDKNFILAYAVTEDKVGPYTQQNGWVGNSSPYAGEWATKPASVKLIYNDVARQLDKYSGITGSVPAEINAGEKYQFSHDVKLVNAINDFDLIHVIVYVINRKTGVIENACTIVSDGNGNYAGIETVVVDNDEDAPVEYYNLQGVRVNNPSTGVYIRRQGNKVSKVLMH